MADSATVPELPQSQIAKIQAKFQNKELTPLQQNVFNNLLDEVIGNNIVINKYKGQSKL
jgi:hypothetical protein